MLFLKTKGIKLQLRDPDALDYTQTQETFHPPFDLDDSSIPEEFPLVSQDILMFCGKNPSRSTIFKPSNAIILPSYQSPLFRLLPMGFSKYLRNESFFYPKSMNEQFVVYRLNRTDLDCIEFSFYRQNGKYESSIRLKIHGIKDYTNANLSISPNGRYIFYVEQNDDYDEELAKQSIDPKSGRHSGRFTSKTSKLIGRVSEIVSLRTKKDKVKLNKTMKRFKALRGKALMSKFEEAVDFKDVTFSLKPIRSIADVGNTFSLYDDPYKDENEESSRLFVTDTGAVMFLDKISHIINYDGIDLMKHIEGKIGYVPGSNRKTKNTIESMNWTFSQNGLVAYSTEEIFYIGVNVKRKKPKKVKKIDFKINKTRNHVSRIHSCPDPRFIVICIANKYEECILLLWDIKTNTELYNYSVSGRYKFICKPDCQYGIVLCKDYYINLDVGLINYYFDHDFSDYPWSEDQQGYKMDKGENTVLYKGKLLMKEMYEECETLQMILDEKVIYNENTVTDRLQDRLMMLQIDGNTILHLFCLDAVQLKSMLEYMMNKKKYMLNGILMKNHKGKTPIDIAIKYESQRTINLFFRSLAELKEGSYSRLVYSKFDRLLGMGLYSFLEYLDSCYFQTIQMKNTQFLKLKNMNFKDKVVLTHTTCLIDEEFLRKYTNEKEVAHLAPSKKKSVRKKGEMDKKLEEDYNSGDVAEGISESEEDNGEVESSISEGLGNVEASEYQSDMSEGPPRMVTDGRAPVQILNDNEAFISPKKDDKNDSDSDNERFETNHRLKENKSRKSKGSKEVALKESSSQNESGGEYESNYHDPIDEEDVYVEVEESHILKEGGSESSKNDSEGEEESSGEAEGAHSNQEGFVSVGHGQNRIEVEPKTPYKRRKAKEENREYNPTYSVFQTENKFMNAHDDELRNFYDNKNQVDDDYFDNIRGGDTEIKRKRTDRLIPPKVVNETEADEIRLKQLERQIKIDGLKDLEMPVEDKMALLLASKKDIKIDTLTKEEIKVLRKLESKEYFKENLTNKMPLLRIKAIEFDWLFGKAGAHFLSSMAATESIELFSLEVVQIIILFFWQYYKKKIIMASLIPFLLYFGCFVAYTTFTHYEDEDDETWKIVNWVLMGCIAALALYHILLELLYLKEKRFRYFKSFWTYINLLTIGLSVAALFIDYYDLSDRKYFIPVTASGVILFYLKLFYFGRIINATSTIVRMTIEVSKDMVPFLFVVSIVVLGFTNSLFIIAKVVDESKVTDDGRFSTDNFFLAGMWTWMQGLGEFDTDRFEESQHEWLVYIIWILGIFFILIVFLNLLIAVLSDSFDKIQETLENNLYKEMCTMMEENEIFINRKRAFRGVKYLFIIEKVGYRKDTDQWGGRLDYVNKIVKKTTALHTERMDRIVSNIELRYGGILKTRVSGLHSKTDRSLNQVTDKVDKLEMYSSNYRDLYLQAMNVNR